MAKNGRDDDPPIGDNDPAPLFLSGVSKVLTDAEYQERFGPPYGPCGIACDCEHCHEYRDKLRREGPGPVTSTDGFKRAINNILKNEPRAEWRELIRGSECFARLWRDEDDSVCDELDCDLRNLCQATWNSVKGGYISPHESLGAPAQVRQLGKKKKGHPPKTAKRIIGGRYSRTPYVSTGRPVDRIAREIYEFLKTPSHLPNAWSYGASKTQAQINEAQEQFISKFGSGLFVIERASYIHYMLNGEHLMRFWVNAARGGWMDLCSDLARTVMRFGRMDPAKTPISGGSTKFKFYPFRVFLSTEKSVDQFKEALTNHPGLEYLFKRSNED